MAKVICLYHANCLDGFGSAAIVPWLASQTDLLAEDWQVLYFEDEIPF